MNKVIVKNQEVEEFKVGNLFIDDTNGEVYLLARPSTSKYVAICINDGRGWGYPTKEAKEAVDGLTFLGRSAKIKITLK